jgi:hypothetical protein
MNIPSANLEPERYKGKPLLIILENYILDSIGELPPEKQQGMQTIVQRVYGGGANWKETIRLTLQLGADIENNFRQLWTRNQEIAKINGIVLQPVQFARMIADTNFAHLIDSRNT